MFHDPDFPNVFYNNVPSKILRKWMDEQIKSEVKGFFHDHYNTTFIGIITETNLASGALNNKHIKVVFNRTLMPRNTLVYVSATTNFKYYLGLITQIDMTQRVEEIMQFRIKVMGSIPLLELVSLKKPKPQVFLFR